jgi:hypothetical protein
VRVVVCVCLGRAIQMEVKSSQVKSSQVKSSHSNKVKVNSMLYVVCCMLHAVCSGMLYVAWLARDGDLVSLWFVLMTAVHSTVDYRHSSLQQATIG